MALLCYAIVRVLRKESCFVVTRWFLNKSSFGFLLIEFNKFVDFSTHFIDEVSVNHFLAIIEVFFYIVLLET